MKYRSGCPMERSIAQAYAQLILWLEAEHGWDRWRAYDLLTHVGRLSERLGLSRERTPEKIEIDLAKLVPQKLWTLFSHWLIWHGRRRCSARKPDCLQCEIQTLCPTGRKLLSGRA